jgi:tRNA(His) 5'-end guanylyltransferase
LLENKMSKEEKESKDPMGERMKFWEKRENSDRVSSFLPICVRLDGKAFHTFTKGLERPYDKRLSDLMICTAKHLVEKTHAKIAYTQSDEISLIYSYPKESQPLFGGKVFKLTSVLAGMASSFFASQLHLFLPEKVGSTPCFDCRVWQMPSLEEAANAILWRWFDARKNSVSMLAQSEFSSKQLHGKDCTAMKEMLSEKGMDWDTYPEFFKWGSFIQRKAYQETLSPEILAKIPKKHRPKGPVTRSRVDKIHMPPFIEVANRADVIFQGADPERIQ